MHSTSFTCIQLNSQKRRKFLGQNLQEMRGSIDFVWWVRRIAFLLTLVQSSVHPSTARKTGQIHWQTRTVQLCRRFAQKFIALVGSFTAAKQGVDWFRKRWYMFVHFAHMAHEVASCSAHFLQSHAGCQKPITLSDHEHTTMLDFSTLAN